MWLRRVKTAALHKVRLFSCNLINVHSCIALENKVNTQLLANAHVAPGFEMQMGPPMWLYFVFYSLTFAVRMTTLVSGS